MDNSIAASAVAAVVMMAVYSGDASSQQSVSGKSVAPAAVNRFVYDGKPMPYQQARWQAVIYLTSRGPYAGLLCGGTIIAEQWILTAAHCFWNPYTEARYDKQLISIGIGSGTLTGSLERVEVDDVIEHPEFKKPGAWENDVALIRTVTKLRFPPITLAATSDDQQFIKPGVFLRVTGWGRTETQNVSKVLLYADIPVAAADVCSKIDAYAGRITDGVICIGQPPRDTCKGDSGGPAFMAVPGGSGIQYGVTVAGEGCGKNPGIYSRVARHRSWIQKEISATNSQLLDPAKLRVEVTLCTPNMMLKGQC